MSDSQPDIVIYGSPVSPFARKVMATCLIKGIPFELEAVNIFAMPDWFLEISPMRRIPVMRDRSIANEGPDGTIADSSAICAYLEKKVPEPAIYPAEAYAHGRALAIEEYADTTLAMAGGMGIFRPIFFSITQGKEPDLETAKATWAEKLPPVFDYLEETLGDGEFFAGDALSIADIAVTACFMQIQFVAKTPLDNWPNLAAFLERMQKHPAIAGPFTKAEGFVRKALPEPFDLT